MGAFGRSARVGRRTENPPTPESKKRIGAFASIRPVIAGSEATTQSSLRCWTLRCARNDGGLRAAVGLLLTPPMTREILLAFGLGYLFGSIPFGLVLSLLAGKGDVRKIGSGNIGATNVLRTGSKLLAALTLILDCLKATAAVLVAQRLLGPEAAAAAGAGALIGHMYPVWLGFRGGKGVATFLGVLVALLPI